MKDDSMKDERIKDERLLKAEELLLRALLFMNKVPNRIYDKHYPLCMEIDIFLGRVK